MIHRMINVGFGNMLPVSRIVAIVNPKSSPMKKLRDDAREQKRLIDVTEGRRTRAIIILDSNHLVLSAVQPETINVRFNSIEEPSIKGAKEEPVKREIIP